MARVTVNVHELSSTAVVVSSNRDDVRLEPGQAQEFEGGTVSVRDAAAVDDPGPTLLGALDVFDPGNRPNGIGRAEIGPKIPKSAGETYQEPTGDGRIIERTVPVDPALAIAEGGPEGAEEGKTPGPQPTGGSTGTKLTGAETGSSPAGSRASNEPAPQRPASTTTTSRPAASSASPKK